MAPSPAAPRDQNSTPTLAAIRAFAEIVVAADLDGLHFQHLALCRRRAWLHLQRLRYDHLDARMALGSALHDGVKPRDASVEGLMGIAPDRIDWERRIAFEAKGSAGASAAVSKQNAFYAVMLWAAQGRPWQAKTDLIRSKRSRDVALTPELVDAMIRDARDLAALRQARQAPAVPFTPFCASCSFQRLCGA